jgi:hypothetical protein
MGRFKKAIDMAVRKGLVEKGLVANTTATPTQQGVNAPPPSIAKTGTTNTSGVFLTTARQQRDINNVKTTPRNIMEWKDIK